MNEVVQKKTVLVPPKIPAEAIEERPVDDKVNHPSHYCQGGIEVIDVLEAFADHSPGTNGFIEHCRMTAIAYMLRAPFKGNFQQDMEKAQWYINRMVGSMLTKDR